MPPRKAPSAQRHIHFVNEYLIPWYIVSYRHEGAKTPCDGALRFQSGKGTEFVFHFHVEQMKSYLQRQCYLFFRSENRQISNEDLENMGQNLLNDLTSTLHRNNPAIGREILFWVYSKRCVIRKPIDINDLLNFVSSMGFRDLKDLIITNDLHSMSPEVSLPVVCTFRSSLLGYRLPDKFRLGLHLYEDEYFYVDEVTRPTVQHSPSLLKFSDVGTFYGEDERTSPFMATAYAENRGSVFTVRGPRGVRSFETFIRYITDITHYSHQPFEVPPPVFPMVKRSEDPEDDSESEFDEDLREVIQGQINISLHLMDVFRLQILSNDHTGIRQAVSMAIAESQNVSYSFTVDDPEFFFDMSCRQPFFTIYCSSIDGLAHFMKAYVSFGTAWRFALELRRPSTETMEKMMRAVRVVGFYSLFYVFYIVQSSKESMLKVVEKLADDSENPSQPEGTGPLTVLEVPDFKYLQRSKPAKVVAK